MQTWSIRYKDPDYIVRSDNGDMVFSNYKQIVVFAKSLEGEHQFWDLAAEGVIELYHGIVTKLDTQAGLADHYMMSMWESSSITKKP